MGIPIVAPTGGLTDTVQDGRTGLVMEHECNSEALTDDDVSMMVNNLNRACALAADPMRYRGMQVQAMEASESFTWAAGESCLQVICLKIGISYMSTLGHRRPACVTSCSTHGGRAGSCARWNMPMYVFVFVYACTCMNMDIYENIDMDIYIVSCSGGVRV